MTGISRFPLSAPFAMVAPAPNGVDDTANIQRLLNEAPAVGAIVVLRRGTYKVPNGGLVASQQVTIMGAGGSHPSNAQTLIECSSTTATVLTIAAHGCRLQGFGVRNTATDPLTAGAGIRVNAGNRMSIDDVGVFSFYIGIDV
mgnify:CR=1 FL=1